jgi:hypothetical protein
MLRAACCVMVLPPCTAWPEVATLNSARVTPIQSRPLCSKKRSSSAASTAWRTSGGTSSKRTGMRRCSPICETSPPERV